MVKTSKICKIFMESKISWQWSDNVCSCLTSDDVVGDHPRPCVQEWKLIVPGFLLLQEKQSVLLLLLLLLVDQGILAPLLVIPHLLIFFHLVQGVKCVLPPKKAIWSIWSISLDKISRQWRQEWRRIDAVKQGGRWCGEEWFLKQPLAGVAQSPPHFLQTFLGGRSRIESVYWI